MKHICPLCGCITCTEEDAKSHARAHIMYGHKLPSVLNATRDWRRELLKPSS